MTVEPSGPDSLDPSRGSTTAVVPPGSASGELVVVADRRGRDEAHVQWAIGAATEVVRDWSERVERLLVVDLDLERSRLAASLGASGAEGATDLLLFGASLSRIAEAHPDGFQLASAGTPVADPATVLDHPGWDRIVDGFRRARATLLIYLPLDQPGAGSLLARADRIVVLGRPDPDEADPVEDLADRVTATLSPVLEEDEAVVDVRDLAPDEADPVEDLADHPTASLSPVQEEDEAVVDIRDLAPDEPVVDIRDLAPDEPVGIARHADAEPGLHAEQAGVEGPPGDFPADPVDADDVRARAPEEADPFFGFDPTVDVDPDPGAGDPDAMDRSAEADEADEEADRIVEIADLAPDEPAALRPPPEDREGGVPEDRAGVEDLPPDFPEKPSPEAEAEDRVVPFGPEVGEVEEQTTFPSPDVADDGPATAPDADQPTLSMEQPMEPAEEGAAPDDEAGEPVEIDELAPDEPAALRPPPDDEEGGLPEDRAGVEGLAPDFPEEPSPEAEVEDHVVPFGPEAGDVEEPATGVSEDFGTEEMPTDVEAAEPLDASSDEAGTDAEHVVAEPDDDEEAEEEGFGAFDLGALDDLAEGTERAEDVEEPSFSEEPTDAAETTDAEETTEDEAFDFGGFGGEIDLLEEEEPEPEKQKESDGDVSLDAGEPGAEDPIGESGPEGDDFGDSLVTGPDFGQGAPGDEDDLWRMEEDDAEEEPAERTPPPERPAAGAAEAGTAAAAGGAGRRVERRDTSGEAGGKAPAPERDVAEKADRAAGRPIRLLLLLLLVAVGAGAAHWFGIVDVPGMDRVVTSLLGPAATGPAPVVETAGPQPASPVLSRSLMIDAYRDPRSAGDVAVALQERLPGHVFSVSPVQEEGGLSYRLLAGPATSDQEADALRGPLAEVLTREDPSDWTVQPTPLSFLIGEEASLQGARARAEALASEDVHTHVLRVSAPGGGEAFRVYAGAYADPEQARAMQGLLSRAGVDGAVFTERRGEVP